MALYNTKLFIAGRIPNFEINLNRNIENENPWQEYPIDDIRCDSLKNCLHFDQDRSSGSGCDFTEYLC